MKRGEFMDFRHEVKFEIGMADYITIKQRLNAVAYSDPHAINGRYFIRSLYFDNIYDKALWEKKSGISIREKFRIRYYNGDTNVIHLEKKSKISNLGNKQSAPLTAKQAQSIVDGNTGWMITSEHPLIRELYAKMTSEGIRPQTIVDYTREPYIFPAGNVRVTLDYDIRSGIKCTDFLNHDCVTVPASDIILLEVKWDAFLPDIIRDAVSLADMHEGSFSKYEACRIYG